MSREELNKKAEEIGLKVDGRWSDEKLQSKIDEKLSGGKPNKGATKYSPLTKSRVEILGVHIFDGFAPSDALVKNDRFMAKLKHSVKCGLINELTD